mmetsp:Transcript_26555/g.43138  ORF Transcript_26555/g.43138 Transcript_26555/m.43138 type:complete len:88 (-) Transcript_26555:35-298(-)
MESDIGRMQALSLERGCFALFVSTISYSGCLCSSFIDRRRCDGSASCESEAYWLTLFLNTYSREINRRNNSTKDTFDDVDGESQDNP